MSKKMKKGLVPELRFPEFRNSGEWKLSPLKKLATSCTEKNRDGNIVKVLTNSAEHGIVDQRDYFDKDIAVQGNLEGYFIVKKGDFVYNPRISSMAPVGPISKNNIATGVMSPLYTVFRFNFENDDYYVHFFKTSGWHHYMRQVSSTGARHDRMAISKSDFIAMPIPTPPFQEEQQKIADCLSSLDELITAHTQKHQALQSYKKGLLQNLFPAEGETVPALRFPEFEDAREWNVSTIDDIASVSSGGTPSRSEPSYWGGQIPWVSTTLIDFNKIESVNEFINESGLNNSSAKLFPKGTILMAMYGQGKTRGKVAILGIEAAINQACAAISLKKGMNGVFVFQNLAARYDEIRNISNQGGQENLSGALIKTIPFAYPEIGSGEQELVADCLSSVDDLINAQAQKIEYLKSHKKGLMQQLFPSVDEVGA